MRQGWRVRWDLRDAWLGTGKRRGGTGGLGMVRVVGMIGMVGMVGVVVTS